MICLDDNFDENPKFIDLSNDATALWVRCLGYCRRNRTDGFIPEAIARSKARCRATMRAINELLAAPKSAPGKSALWDRVPGGYQVHDYLKDGWNPSRAEVEARAEQKRASAKLGGIASGKARSKVLVEPERNQERTDIEAPCFDSGSTKTNPAPIRSAPVRSGPEQISTDTTTPQVFSEGPDAVRAALGRALRESRYTQFVADDPNAMGLLVELVDRVALPQDAIPAAVEWAADKLGPESAAIGGGFPLNLETTLKRVVAGVKGEATKRRREPRTGVPAAEPDRAPPIRVPDDVVARGQDRSHFAALASQWKRDE